VRAEKPNRCATDGVYEHFSMFEGQYFPICQLLSQPSMQPPRFWGRTSGSACTATSSARMQPLRFLGAGFRSSTQRTPPAIDAAAPFWGRTSGCRALSARSRWMQPPRFWGWTSGMSAALAQLPAMQPPRFWGRTVQMLLLHPQRRISFGGWTLVNQCRATVGRGLAYVADTELC
jgi:hypothetical protein